MGKLPKLFVPQFPLCKMKIIHLPLRPMKMERVYICKAFGMGSTWHVVGVSVCQEKRSHGEIMELFLPAFLLLPTLHCSWALTEVTGVPPGRQAGLRQPGQHRGRLTHTVPADCCFSSLATRLQGLTVVKSQITEVPSSSSLQSLGKRMPWSWSCHFLTLSSCTSVYTCPWPPISPMGIEPKCLHLRFL